MRKAASTAQRRPRQNLVSKPEVEDDSPSPQAGVLDILAQRLAEEFLGKLEVALQDAVNRKSLEMGLGQPAQQLQEVEPTDGQDDDDDEDGTGSSFPNLKYAKPKYKDVESVLRYVESSEDTGGIKLVIMNFND